MILTRFWVAFSFVFFLYIGILDSYINFRSLLVNAYDDISSYINFRLSDFPHANVYDDISIYRQHYKSEHWAPCHNQTVTPSWYDWKTVWKQC